MIEMDRSVVYIFISNSYCSKYYAIFNGSHYNEYTPRNNYEYSFSKWFKIRRINIKWNICILAFKNICQIKLFVNYDKISEMDEIILHNLTFFFW